MSVLIRGMEMPKHCGECGIEWCEKWKRLIIAGMSIAKSRPSDCPLLPIPPHGDLIDRDALMKDGWLSLHKEVIRMGGYAIHELPLKNPSIPVIIEAEDGERNE